MSSVESRSAVTSRNRPVASDSECCSGAQRQPFTVASDSDDTDWFGRMARGLLGKDAGFGLATLTGRPEGSCYKYCTEQEASRRMPPAYLLVQTLRSRQGAQWLAAIMDGSDAPWWLEHQRSVRLAAAAERFKREID